jgi:hypothetical protein
MPIAEIADVLTFVGLTAGAIGGSVATWCSDHPVDGCVHNRRDILDTKSVPRIQVARQDVGPCNVPKYNFDQCSDEVKAASVKVVSSIPSAGGQYYPNLGSINSVTARPGR